MVANTSKDHGDTSEDSSELVDAEDASLAYQYDNSPPDPDAVNTASYQAFWNRPDGVTEFERKGKSYYIYGGEVYCRVARGKNREGRTLLCHTAVGASGENTRLQLNVFLDALLMQTKAHVPYQDSTSARMGSVAGQWIEQAWKEVLRE